MFDGVHFIHLTSYLKLSKQLTADAAVMNFQPRINQLNIDFY